jgi:hypothetical protein
MCRTTEVRLIKLSKKVIFVCYQIKFEFLFQIANCIYYGRNECPCRVAAAGAHVSI